MAKQTGSYVGDGKQGRTIPGTEGMRSVVVGEQRPVKVRATRLGYYGTVRRRAGDVFTVRAEHVSARWMARVPADTPETATTAPEALRREHTAILEQITPPKPPMPGGPTGDQNVLDV